MSVTVQRWKGKCEGCGREIVDSSETFVRDASNAHAEKCDELEAGDEVVVEEVTA